MLSFKTIFPRKVKFEVSKIAFTFFSKKENKGNKSVRNPIKSYNRNIKNDNTI